MTFFSSAKSWKNFAFADIDSYVKKSEKNIGAKIERVKRCTIRLWYLKVVYLVDNQEKNIAYALFLT